MSSGAGSSSEFRLAFDPYEKMLEDEKYSKNLIGFDSSSKMAKKWNRLKGKMAGAKDNMIQGAIMGFMVGGLFGFAVGCYSAIQTRRFMAIPISTIVSGASFSFILGCGSMVRTAEMPALQLALPETESQSWLSAYNFNRVGHILLDQ